MTPRCGAVIWRLSAGNVKGESDTAMAGEKTKRKLERDSSKHREQSVAAALAKLLRAAKAIRRTGKLIKRDLRECERLHRAVCAAFSPQLFLPGQSATSPTNLQRFKTYLKMIKCLFQLKIRLIHELMRVHGIDPQHPEEMWALPESIALAAVLPAGLQHPQVLADRRSKCGQLIQPPSKQVARIAVGLTKHCS
jgi:hypothetical protein